MVALCIKWCQVIEQMQMILLHRNQLWLPSNQTTQEKWKKLDKIYVVYDPRNNTFSVILRDFVFKWQNIKSLSFHMIAVYSWCDFMITIWFNIWSTEAYTVMTPTVAVGYSNYFAIRSPSHPLYVGTFWWWWKRPDFLPCESMKGNLSCKQTN